MNGNESPQDIPLLTYAIILFLSAWGGSVSFLHRSLIAKKVAFTLAEFFAEVSISSFTGVMIFFLCAKGNLDPFLTAAIVGVSGHMGSRLIFKLEIWGTRKFFGQQTNESSEK